MNFEGGVHFLRVHDRVATSGSLTLAELSRVIDGGCQAVVDLLPDDNPSALAGEREAVEARGASYFRIPVNFQAPSLADFEAFCAVMDRCADRPVWVHCAANYRASAFAAWHACRTGRLTEEESEDLILSVWNPDDYPGWPEWTDAVKLRLSSGE